MQSKGKQVGLAEDNARGKQKSMTDNRHWDMYVHYWTGKRTCTTRSLYSLVIRTPPDTPTPLVRLLALKKVLKPPKRKTN